VLTGIDSKHYETAQGPCFSYLWQAAGLEFRLAGASACCGCSEREDGVRCSLWAVQCL